MLLPYDVTPALDKVLKDYGESCQRADFQQLCYGDLLVKPALDTKSVKPILLILWNCSLRRLIR